MKKALIAILLASFVLTAMAAVKTQNIKDLKTALKSGRPVVVKLGADNCYPCRLMKPILSLDLDIYEHRDLARQFRVSLIPTILFYDKKGKYRSQQVGFMSRDQLLTEVGKLK